MHTHFLTTTTSLPRHAFPLMLYEKAKRLGIWNPSTIDLSQDKLDWLKLNEEERQLLLHLTSLFQAGEEAVTLDILPLMLTIAKEGRLDEEMFLTTFLFEEAKHVDFFRRLLDEVFGEPGNLSRFHTPNYRALFYDALPKNLSSLLNDSSPTAQVRASITYHIIVEGVLAETGYHAYLLALERNHLMPGQCHGVRLLKQDESRHIAYGLYLLSRLLHADASLWHVAEETMNELLPAALGVVSDTFSAYEKMPFGLVEADFVDYALAQFQKRLHRLEQARGGHIEEWDS